MSLWTWSALTICQLVHLRREIGPRDALAAMSTTALPVEAPSPDVHLAQLLAARIDVELEATARLRELRNVEVHVDGVLPFDVPRFRSLAHGSETEVGVHFTPRSIRDHVRHLPLLQHGIERCHVARHHPVEL